MQSKASIFTSTTSEQKKGLPPLVLLVGPTAVGKTEIALRLAERMNAEIVSADLRLFYRGMDIGTAKPTPEEQARVPHHLIDIVDPDETLSLSVFQREARLVISGIQARRQAGSIGRRDRAVHTCGDARLDAA